MRFKFSDLLLYILIFIFVVAFPTDLLPVNDTIKLLVEIGLRCLLVGFYIYLIIKNRIKIFGVANVKNVLICMPFILISFSNILAALIDGGFYGLNSEVIDVVLYSILTLLSVISEEIIFRLFIHNSLANTSSLKRIFASAGIFALLHLINIVNVTTVDALVEVLLQTVYTFGLGLLLGLMYEYSHSLTGTVIVHFGFNFFNTVIYKALGGHTSQLWFYLSAVICGVVVGLYAFLLYILYFRKVGRYFRQ